jgi:hypothetical protein
VILTFAYAVELPMTRTIGLPAVTPVWISQYGSASVPAWAFMQVPFLLSTKATSEVAAQLPSKLQTNEAHSS